MVSGVNLHDVIKLDTLTPRSQPTLDLKIIPPTVFNVCFCRLIACVMGAGPREAGDRRIQPAAAQNSPSEITLDSGYW